MVLYILFSYNKNRGEPIKTGKTRVSRSAFGIGSGYKEC